ncbi:MAG: hypothetical protein JJU12_01245 [Chlamydiales bacterium]|nr:hypothetical protein [Chlamydiales bacterium]
MSSPLNSNDLSSIQGVDNEIQEFITQIEKGNAPNPNKLLQIEKQLKSLVNNKNIPDSVKQSLQTALKEISSEGGGGDFSIGSLYGAKEQVDQALEQGKIETKM